MNRRYSDRQKHLPYIHAPLVCTSRANVVHLGERKDGILHFMYHDNENSTVSIPDNKWVLQRRQKAIAVVFRISRIVNNRKDISIS